MLYFLSPNIKSPPCLQRGKTLLVMEVVDKNTGYEQQAAGGGDGGGDGEEETSGGQVQ